MHQHLGDATAHCCAECGKEGGATLKVCKSCMFAKYCNANCQRNHWKKHKKECKLRAAELHDEALFKDPPAKEDCPICFLPMPFKLIACMTLPPATISSVPIHDYAVANEELVNKGTEQYYSCCGKSICGGCMHSFQKSGNAENCPYCKADRVNKTDEEAVEEMMRRVEVNDAGSIMFLGSYYHHGQLGLLRDQERAMELYARAADLGSSKAYYQLGCIYREGGGFEEGQNPLQGRSYGWTRRCKVQLRNNGGTVRKYGTSCEALDDCCIRWALQSHEEHVSCIQSRFD